jgi:hypothetical protein
VSFGPECRSPHCHLCIRQLIWLTQTISFATPNVGTYLGAANTTTHHDATTTTHKRNRETRTTQEVLVLMCAMCSFDWSPTCWLVADVLVGRRRVRWSVSIGMCVNWHVCKCVGWEHLASEIKAIACGITVSKVEGDQETRAIFFFPHPLLDQCDVGESFAQPSRVDNVAWAGCMLPPSLLT